VRRFLFRLILVLALGSGVGFYVSNTRSEIFSLEILQPTKFLGRTAEFDATIRAPNTEFIKLEVLIEQGGVSTLLFSLEQPGSSRFEQISEDKIRISHTFNHTAYPTLHTGPGTISLTASIPTFFGFRERTAEVRTDIEIRFELPEVTVLSQFHHVNHGGAEFILYQVSPVDSSSGVVVGNQEYQGYSVPRNNNSPDAGIRAAYFALLAEQDFNTPFNIFARDPAGNETRVSFNHRRFPRNFRRSQIQVDNAFLRRVMPEMIERVPDLADEDSDVSNQELLDLYLFINGELRRRNRAALVTLSDKTASWMSWEDGFRQLINSQVESGFADHRTYLYQGNEIDQQIHLGFDLASTANAPIQAANKGRVIYSDYLGIFGNCVVIDHGMGLQTLYAHLSSINVQNGDVVMKDHEIGRSGQTGLAGGDHLHFSTLLAGRPVSPVEWWDDHWIEDRVFRKIRALEVTLP
tara:strand:- start:83440 stop:84831 length:1392 start_codon:yes stop_codon:yes gene_type:complete